MRTTIITKPYLLLVLLCLLACKNTPESTKESKDKNNQLPSDDLPFVWEGANVYFMLTDRFNNGDESNDLVLDRTKETGKLRGFEGGDIKGITQKIKEGYFKDLGVNAIWFTPVVEQIHGSTNEGTGNTYAFHGYWAKDWTKIDPNFGTYDDLKNLIETAHNNDIRILMDVVMNHTGPVTDQDPVWPEEWVRTEPQCTYKDYTSAVSCTLVENLPDMRTESDKEVELPQTLMDKWKSEGRLQEELEELERFFASTGLKKTPKNYIIKWLTDYVRELGIDGYRVDTVKHVEESVWSDLAKYASEAFEQWKKNNPDKVLDNAPFYVLGELYGYGIGGKRFYDFGDRKVDYYANGFDNLINFQFKYDAANLNYEELFTKYGKTLNTSLIGKSVMNYISSHDDGEPFDKERKKTYKSATKLLLTPGISQIYYGDEIARPLIIEGTEGDATLRSKMDWESINEQERNKLLLHWQKLGRFRKNHPAIGAGKHKMITQSPYVFSRVYDKNGYSNKIIIGLDLQKGKKIISTGTVFTDGTKLIDKYSGQETIVSNGKTEVESEFDIVLLERQ